MMFFLIHYLYGCEAWSLTLREKHRLRVFENSLLRRVFGPKGDDVTGGWGKLRNELRVIIRMKNSMRIRWAMHVARMGG
jgi:hypothetical protein